MNKRFIYILMLFCFLSPVLVSGQSTSRGNGVNGSTGIIVSPSARIGWESRDFGLDFGYSFLYDGSSMNHVPFISLSLLKRIEVSSAVVISHNDHWNLLLNGKFQFFREGGSAMALGFNIDLEKSFNQNLGFNFTPFLVVSYSGNFFSWPAITSILFGWNMVETSPGSSSRITSNFAFSMGFELAIFPDVFNKYVYWISDFSNYSFAANASINANHRGSFNTGIRITPVKNEKVKLVFNLVGTDLLDASRGLVASASFGFAF